MSKPTRTHKLGPIEDQPSTHSMFTMRRRMPGWHPDADDNGYGKRKELFIEEAVGRDQHRTLQPFPVPTSKDGTTPVPFREPTNAADGPEFNQWILGGPIPDEQPRESALTTLLRELAVLARRYNASLYRLRRLHFFVTVGRDLAAPLPPKNPFGDKDLTADPVVLQRMVNEAEQDFKNVTKAIDHFIDNAEFGPFQLRLLAADMVEVNGYIVSMRVVARDFAPNVEAGGSSSHVSISSAFSSS